MRTCTKSIQGQRRWPVGFTENRPFTDQGFFETRNLLLEKEKDILDEFYVDFETTIPSWNTSVVRNFFKNPPEVKSSSQHQGRAKLDGRCYDAKLRREYPDWLTPAELEHHLSAKRFDNADYPDVNVDRQLVYIYRLCPQYILGLIHNAYRHQQGPLRDTIWQHIACEAVMRVRVPMDGFKTYLLEFHMPFLTLRHATEPATASVADRDGLDVWPPAATVTLDCDEHKGLCKCIVREANVSVAVCGWDQHKWTCWAFSNTHSDPTTRNEEAPEEDDMQEDFIATDGNGPEDGTVIDASVPIWDGRDYWLRVVDLRMRIIHEEWKWLVMNTEAKVRVWKRQNPLLFQAKALGYKQREKAEELLEGILQLMDLLGLLSEKLAMTVQAFTRFEGDKRYFLDMQGERTASTFDSLQETSERLVVLQNKLIRLEQSCDKTERITELLMAYVGNQLNSETQKHTREAHKVNLATNRVSQKMAVLNSKSTQAAVESSRTTRINVQLFLVTTPFVLALQYFGADKDIFSFERNPRTFSYAICILFIALPILTYVLSLLNHHWDVFFTWICGKKDTELYEEPALGLEDDLQFTTNVA